MPDETARTTVRGRRARKVEQDAASVVTTTAVAVQTVTEHDPARLDQRITAIEGHLGEQDRHLEAQDRLLAERTIAVDGQFAEVRNNLLMQDRHIAERAEVVDAQFRTLHDGQHAMLEIIQALPPIPKEDADYLHALANEWPPVKIEARTERMGRFDHFIDEVLPLVPILHGLVSVAPALTRVVDKQAADDVRAKDVADALKVDTEERRQQAQHFWQLAHAAVRWFLAASLTILGGVPVGLSVYLFSSHQVSGTTLALVLLGTVAVAIAAYLFVAARLKAVGPLPTTTMIEPIATVEA